MQNSCDQYQNCPMITVHRLISGKWKILILWYINDQTLRFSDLKKKLPDITQKMLTNQLRSLEEDGLISRTVYPVVPPKVEYSLTEIGLEMLPLLKSMYDYGVTYNNSQKS
ncbi:MAG: helix-turn-helix transcriptional regulator [Cellulosilyticum sp.]|nr:helix-turn-helix transcriptional regulator [Cellulosilyticum sp.]